VDGGEEESAAYKGPSHAGPRSSLSAMPLAGSLHSAAVKDEVPYFTSLQDLDDWLEQGHAKLEGVAPYPHAHRPRPGDGHGGQLLVRCARVALLVDERSDVD
jgi:hypothetical protein